MIEIKRNPNGDTRTATKDVTFEEFRKANAQHILDVMNTMTMLSSALRERAYKHDFTKVIKEEKFYKDFKDTLENGINFVEGEWYQEHITKERHHLTSKCPKDVNLIDVIEMICDCVCAGLARSGEVRELEITDEILKMATQNTIELIKNNIVVIGENK